MLSSARLGAPFCVTGAALWRWLAKFRGRRSISCVCAHAYVAWRKTLSSAQLGAPYLGDRRNFLAMLANFLAGAASPGVERADAGPDLRDRRSALEMACKCRGPSLSHSLTHSLTHSLARSLCLLSRSKQFLLDPANYTPALRTHVAMHHDGILLASENKQNSSCEHVMLLCACLQAAGKEGLTALLAAEKELRATGSPTQKDVAPDWFDVAGAHDSKTPDTMFQTFAAFANGAPRAFSVQRHFRSSSSTVAFGGGLSLFQEISRFRTWKSTLCSRNWLIANSQAGNSGVARAMSPAGARPILPVSG